LLSFQKELKINIEILGAAHAEVAITYQSIADFFRISSVSSSKIEDALTHYKLSLKILENRPFPREASDIQVDSALKKAAKPVKSLFSEDKMPSDIFAYVRLHRRYTSKSGNLRETAGRPEEPGETLQRQQRLDDSSFYSSPLKDMCKETLEAAAS
jgi:hypothetical protein